MKKATLSIVAMALLLCVSVTGAVFGYVQNMEGDPHPQPTATKPIPNDPPLQKGTPEPPLLRYAVKKTYRKVKLTVYYGPDSRGRYHKKINGKGEKTATGTKPRYGIVAADPKVFPMGTKLLIKDPLDGQKRIFVVEDKGSRVKGLHLDFFTGFGKIGKDRADAIGLKYVEVEVVRLVS